MLKQDNVAYNQQMQDKPHILIFCQDSWINYLAGENSKASNLLKTIGLIIFDESHLQKKTIIETRKVLPEISIHYYSATPNIDSDSAVFSFKRDDAIQKGHIPPIYVDSTLPNKIDADDISKVISWQEHPNGGYLYKHKGIIYVDNIEYAKKLALKLKDVLGAENVFEIHTSYSDYSTNIKKFREVKSGAVAIAVDMIHEGYNDERVDFVIYAKTSSVTNALKDQLTQASGRLHRLCADRPNKIGFLITSKQYEGIVNSCSPNFLPSVKEVLTTLRSSMQLGLETQVNAALTMPNMLDAISWPSALQRPSSTIQPLRQYGGLAEEMLKIQKGPLHDDMDSESKKRKFGG
jgi:hypothetical protein